MATTYRMTIAGAQHTVEVLDDGAELAICIDGQTFAVDLRTFERAVGSLLIDGESFETIAVERPFGYEILIDNEIFDVEFERTGLARLRGLAGATEAAGPTEIRAPLTGTIVEVLIGPGDTVSAGQVLVIIESMKMNNELRASRGGTVQAVHVTAGARVERDTPLVTIA